MKIKDVIFDKTVSIDSKTFFTDNLKQVVFIWRSNVWKSSLLNTIFNKKNLVKTSRTSGKTRTPNLFKVNNKYHFVDLPWYWFAKLWLENKQKIDNTISWYLDEFKFYIKKVVIILDARIWPTQSDIDMFKYIQELNLPLVFLLNKIDKLNKTETTKSILHSQEIFFWQLVIWVSALKKIWIEELNKELFSSFN